MRVDLRDLQRQPVGRATIDAAVRPTRIAAEPVRRSILRMGTGAAPADSPPAASREVFLDWDTAVDDSGQLRRCIACGCPDLFAEKAFPQVTAVIVVMAFIGAIVGALGLANTPVLYAMLVILVLDIAILILSRRRLVCYRCRSAFSQLPIARYHRSWDRAVADRYPVPPRTTEPALATSAEGASAEKTGVMAATTETESSTTNYFASG